MAKISQRYNPVPRLTQDTTLESDKSTIMITKKSQEFSLFPADDHKTAIDRHESMKSTRHEITNDPQKVLPWNGR